MASSCAQTAAKHDRNAFTFTKYNLNLTIEPETSLITARGTITLRNDSATPQSAVALQLGSQLKWASIKIAGNPITFDTAKLASDIDHTGHIVEATFELPQPIAPKATTDIEVGYSGSITHDTTRLTQVGVPMEQAKSSDWDRIGADFTALRGVGHVVWYPVALEPAVLTQRNKLFIELSDFRARHQDSSMALAVASSQWSGFLLSCNCQQNGNAEFGKSKQDMLEFTHFGMDGPFFVIGKFEALSTHQALVYAQPSQTIAAAKYADAAKKVAPEVASWLRPAKDRVTIVQHPDANAVPFESGPFLLTPFVDNDRAIQLQLAHAVAHAAMPSSRAWIAEGLAHYAQAREREVQGGRKAAITYLLDRLSGLVLDEPADIKSSPDTAARSLINTGDEVHYRVKAMYVWWMLHDMLGDDPLTKALRNYRGADDKEPLYLERLIEQKSHRNLDWFFADWIYRDRGLPDFRVAQVYPRQTLDKGYIVTVTVENLGDAGAEVPVSIRTKEGDTVTRLEVMGKSKASARVNTLSLPLQVTVNDGSVPESDLTNNVWKAEDQSDKPK